MLLRYRDESTPSAASAGREPSSTREPPPAAFDPQYGSAPAAHSTVNLNPKRVLRQPDSPIAAPQSGALASAAVGSYRALIKDGRK